MANELQEQASKTPANAQRRPAHRQPAHFFQETADAFHVEVLLPGVPKDNLDIDYHKDAVTITGHRADKAVPEGWKALRREIGTQDYQLTLKINVPVNQDAISAKLEDGVLHLSFPKAEEAKPKKIQIS